MPGFIDAIFEIALCVVYYVVGGAIQGLVGVVWPSEDRRVRRWQRYCAVVIGIGILAAIAAVMFHIWAPGIVVPCLASASALAFVISGGMGAMIEWHGRRRLRAGEVDEPRD